MRFKTESEDTDIEIQRIDCCLLEIKLINHKEKETTVIIFNGNMLRDVLYQTGFLSDNFHHLCRTDESEH